MIIELSALKRHGQGWAGELYRYEAPELTGPALAVLVLEHHANGAERVLIEELTGPNTFRPVFDTHATRV